MKALIATLVVIVSLSATAATRLGRKDGTQQAQAETSTEVGRLAATMKTGEWKELVTKGLSRELLKANYPHEKSRGHHILAYAQSMTWYPKTRQLFFLGIGHYSSLKFINYSADSNTWKLMPIPPWAKPRNNTSKKHPRGRWPIGHAYEQNTIDVKRGIFIFHHGRNVRRYNIAAGKWIAQLPIQKPMVRGNCGAKIAMVDFPELGGLVRFNGRTAYLYNYKSRKWSRVHGGGWGPLHGIAEYNPVHKVILFGAGNGNNELFKMDAKGKVTRLKKPPLPSIDCTHRFFVTVDPVGGDYLVLRNQSRNPKAPRQFYAFDVVKDKWRKLGDSPMRGGGVGTPVSNYGVVLFITNPRQPKVWLYKHASSPKKDAQTRKPARHGI
jgi:hypothetical protein